MDSGTSTSQRVSPFMPFGFSLAALLCVVMATRDAWLGAATYCALRAVYWSIRAALGGDTR